jgi:hypothetical protein
MRRTAGRAGITLVSLKRRRSSACNTAGRSAICLSSNRHDHGNEQQTSGTAQLAAHGAVRARGGAKSKSSTRERQSPTSTGSEARQEIAVKIQARAFETLPYIPTGQWSPVTVYRKYLRGVIIAPALFMWNVEKT